MKKANILFIFLLINTIAINTQAQSLVVLIDRPNVTGTTSGEGQGVTVTGFSRGAGIVRNTSGGDYNSRSWTTSSPSLANAKTNNDYIEFSLLVDTDHILDMDEMRIRLDRSGTGPDNFQIEYSTDGFATAGTSLLNSTILSSGSIHTVDLSSISNQNAGTTVTFRVFCWGASSASGTMDIEGFSPSYTSSSWSQTITDPGVEINGCTTADPVTGAGISQTSTTSTISWTNPATCFSSIIVIAKAGSAPTFDPSTQNCSGAAGDCVYGDFTASAVFAGGGSGTNLPSNEYCVYNGTGTSVTVTALTNGTNYHYEIFTHLNPWSTKGSSPDLNITPVPVELISFSGKYSNNQVLLEWTTASELNNSHFIIEKSELGSYFNSIGEVQGSGTSNEINNYKFTSYAVDNSAFYRLKQVDYDGAFEYSSVLKIVKSKNELQIIDKHNNLSVLGTNENPIQYFITNSSGIILETGSSLESIVINKSTFGNGLFIINAIQNGKTKSYKWTTFN